MKIFTTLFALVISLGICAQTYTANSISLVSGGDTLYGTINLPTEPTKIAVVFISGSGPTDRDGNTIGSRGKNNSLKLLADTLSSRGHITLRFDKRGIAQSTKHLAEQELRIDTFINDAVKWVGWLKTNYPNIKNLVIAGHSEGSLIGMIVAEKTGAKGFISLAGAGFKADVILKIQLSKQLPENMLKTTNQMLDSLSQGLIVTQQVNSMLMALFRPSVQPYLISWFRLNPATEIAKLKCPVLIIQGLNDLQVTEEDARALAKAYPKAKLLLLNKMNHVLKDTEKDYVANLATYFNPNLPLNKTLVKQVFKFLASPK